MCFALHAAHPLPCWSLGHWTVFWFLRTHFLPVLFTHSCAVMAVSSPASLFLIIIIFHVNIREAWFQICSVLAHWGSLFMASSLDCSETGFIFQVPHCTLLAHPCLLAIRCQQDRTHKKEEKHPNIFFPLSHILLKPNLEWLKGGVFFPFFLCLELASIRHLFGFRCFPVGLSWGNLPLSSSTFYISKKPLLQGETGLWLKNHRLYILRILSVEWNSLHSFGFKLCWVLNSFWPPSRPQKNKNVKCGCNSLSLCKVNHH